MATWLTLGLSILLPVGVGVILGRLSSATTPCTKESDPDPDPDQLFESRDPLIPMSQDSASTPPGEVHQAGSSTTPFPPTTAASKECCATEVVAWAQLVI